MFTEQRLHDYPAIVKARMGMTTEQFWNLVQQMEQHYPALLNQQRQRPDRQRAVGGGRSHDVPLAIRTALVLTYLRLHSPQGTVALLFGATQSDVSHELRRVLPLIQQCLPCPVVWTIVDDQQPLAPEEHVPLDQRAAGLVLIDATEQRVSRPRDPERHKAYYSGKNRACTRKTHLLADSAHHILTISVAVPGAEHDKQLSDRVQTLAHLPAGCEAIADNGYQGLAAQVAYSTVCDPATDSTTTVPRLTVKTPFKKPKGQALTDEQKAFNRALGVIHIRVEHCIGWAKNWAMLATRFRCDHAIYTAIMRTICGFVNAQTQRWQDAKSNCA